MKTGSYSAFIFQNSDMPAEQAADVWATLQKGITEIQEGNASALRFEELYRNAYTLVLHKHGDLLYDGIEDVIVTKLKRETEKVEKTADGLILETTVETWKYHKVTMTLIRDILMYMDKTYCEQKKKPDSYSLGVSKFKDHVVLCKGVLDRIRDQLLAEIRREREAEVVDESLLRNCLRMFVELDSSPTASLYEKEFEEHFLSATQAYYATEAEDFFSKHSVPEYLEKTEKRLNEEQTRGESYIPRKSTCDKLNATVEKEMITHYIERIIDHDKSGAIPLFERKASADLKRMYSLLGRAQDGHDSLKKKMFQYVKERGVSVLSDGKSATDPQKFVSEILDLRTQFTDIVFEAFNDDKHFQRSLKEAFEHFVNLDTRTAQFLSLYTDGLLRVHAMKMSDQEVLDKLDNVIVIFKYLKDKDIFEEFYKQHLAQRLLQNKGASDHHERSMIARLKTECGHQFTSKLEGMFKDISNSRALLMRWQQHVKKLGIEHEVELECNVLTTGFWPVPKTKGCRMPSELQKQCDRFIQFYVEQHSGRKLVFDTSRGTADLQVDFDKGTKTLVVHTFQMAVLMLFNECDVMTWKQIKDETGIEEDELERYVLAMAHPKVRLLLKRPNSKDLADDHKFKFNTKFTDKRVRVQIGVLEAKQKKKSSGEEMPKQIMEARKNRVEAAIVRIMKARKTLSHANLVAEVVRQISVRFHPDPHFIKQRISSLIERDYLARDDDDRRLYKYLA
jgi:cullin 3